MTPFDLFKQDTDEVIMLLNFYIEKGNDTSHAAHAPQPKQGGRQDRVRVNDKTATGGWF